MLEFVNRIPIGQKLIGLIAGLLSIMLVIAAYSEYVTKKSGEEIEDLTMYLIPPQTALAKIATHLLEQQVHVERALRLATEAKPNDASIETELDAPFTTSFLAFWPTFFTDITHFTWSHLWFLAYLFTFSLLYRRLLLGWIAWRLALAEPSRKSFRWFWFRLTWSV